MGKRRGSGHPKQSPKRNTEEKGGCKSKGVNEAFRRNIPKETKVDKGERGGQQSLVAIQTIKGEELATKERGKTQGIKSVEGDIALGEARDMVPGKMVNRGDTPH